MRELAKNKFIFRKKEIKTLVKLSNRFAVADPSDTYRIDLWIPKTDLEKKAFERKLKRKINSMTINLISPEDLILFKLLTDRPQDIIDIKSILARQKGKLDEQYLKFWSMALDKHKKLKKLEKE